MVISWSFCKSNGNPVLLATDRDLEVHAAAFMVVLSDGLLDYREMALIRLPAKSDQRHIGLNFEF